MDVKDVPQDKKYLRKGKVTDVCYAIGEDGNYTSVQSEGWTPKNDAIAQAWELIYEQMAEAFNKVEKKEISPIAYFMEKSMMDIKLLSQYVIYPKRKVKKHLDPKTFSSLQKSVIRKYADIFKVTSEELCSIEFLRKDLEKYGNQI